MNLLLRSWRIFLAFAARWLALGAASPQIYLQCLANFETYAKTIWHPANYSGAPPDAGHWGDGGAQAGNKGGNGNFILTNGLSVASRWRFYVVRLPCFPSARRPYCGGRRRESRKMAR